MDIFELPEFLQGTFDWRAHGIHLASAPPNGLLGVNSLDHKNPWIVLASVVELCKNGDHEHTHILSRYYENHDVQALSRCALLLTGDVGKKSDLHLLSEALASNDPRTRMYAAEGAALAGQANLVGPMLRAWGAAEGVHDHETIGYCIADLLEEDEGPLAQKAGTYPIRDVDRLLARHPGLKSAEAEIRILSEGPIEFVEQTEESYKEVIGRIEPADAFIWEGFVWSMERFIDRFSSTLSSEVPRSFFDYRHRFEAYTGLDCSSFFDFGIPDILAIASVLEDFLEHDDVRRFVPGQRYFFGHPVPD